MSRLATLACRYGGVGKKNTSNFFSVLYYNLEIWQLNSLKSTLKQKLLSASAKALKSCMKLADNGTSFASIHSACKRACPNEIMKYKLALALYKLYNKDFNVIEFVHLNFNQIFTSRQTHFKILKLHNTKVGLNTLCNRLHLINDKMDLKWLNLSFDSYKVRCKRIFLV